MTDAGDPSGYQELMHETAVVAEQSAEFAAALADAPADETITDCWCSACFDRTDHTRHTPEQPWPQAFLCESCGAPTTPCAASDCPNFAKCPPMPGPLPNYCAEHTHEVPSFETQHLRIAEITEWAKVLTYAQPNLARRPALTPTLPLEVLRAPLASVNSPREALDAALSGSFGATLGRAAGTRIAEAIAKEDKSFDIELLRDGFGAPVLLANGFLSQSLTGWDKWQRMVDERYPSRPVYRVCWGAQELESLKPFVERAERDAEAQVEAAREQPDEGKSTSERSFTQAISDALRTGIAPVGIAAEAAVKWQIAKQRATSTGLVLADLISRTDTKRYVLLGFSLGARVMATTTRALAQARPRRIEAVHLLGGAISRGAQWANLPDAVIEGLWNYYSRNDAVLSLLYKTAEFGGHPIGYEGIEIQSPKVHDVDVTDVVPSHVGYLPKVTLR